MFEAERCLSLFDDIIFKHKIIQNLPSSDDTSNVWCWTLPDFVWRRSIDTIDTDIVVGIAARNWHAEMAEKNEQDWLEQRYPTF